MYWGGGGGGGGHTRKNKACYTLYQWQHTRKISSYSVTDFCFLYFSIEFIKLCFKIRLGVGSGRAHVLFFSFCAISIVPKTTY